MTKGEYAEFRKTWEEFRDHKDVDWLGNRIDEDYKMRQQMLSYERLDFTRIEPNEQLRLLEEGLAMNIRDFNELTTMLRKNREELRKKNHGPFWNSTWFWGIVGVVTAVALTVWQMSKSSDSSQPIESPVPIAFPETDYPGKVKMPEVWNEGK